jgi:hypothetical protein
VVVGDANADWLAYGPEDAFSERPEFGVVRRHRTESGLIHYGGRNDSGWPQVAREIIAAEKPKFMVMVIGNNDHQQIREKAPVQSQARRRRMRNWRSRQWPRSRLMQSFSSPRRLPI